jgi:hypothetical protein
MGLEGLADGEFRTAAAVRKSALSPISPRYGAKAGLLPSKAHDFVSQIAPFGAFPIGEPVIGERLAQSHRRLQNEPRLRFLRRIPYSLELPCT